MTYLSHYSLSKKLDMKRRPITLEELKDLNFDVLNPKERGNKIIYRNETHEYIVERNGESLLLIMSIEHGLQPV